LLKFRFNGFWSKKIIKAVQVSGQLYLNNQGKKV